MADKAPGRCSFRFILTLATVPDAPIDPLLPEKPSRPYRGHALITVRDYCRLSHPDRMHVDEQLDRRRELAYRCVPGDGEGQRYIVGYLPHQTGVPAQQTAPTR